MSLEHVRQLIRSKYRELDVKLDNCSSLLKDIVNLEKLEKEDIKIEEEKKRKENLRQEIKANQMLNEYNKKRDDALKKEYSY